MARKTILGAGGAVLNIINAGDDFPAPPGCTIRDWAPGDAVAQVVEPVRVISPLEFMDRLSTARQAQVEGAALQSPALALWLRRLTAAEYVDLDKPETAEGVTALKAAGIITAAEATALLS